MRVQSFLGEVCGRSCSSCRFIDVFVEYQYVYSSVTSVTSSSCWRKCCVAQVNVSTTGVSRALGGRASGGWARRRRRRGGARPASARATPVPETLQAAQGRPRPRCRPRTAAGCDRSRIYMCFFFFSLSLSRRRSSRVFDFVRRFRKIKVGRYEMFRM